MHIPRKTSLLTASVRFLIRSAMLPEVSDAPVPYPAISAVLPAASAPHPRLHSGNPDSPYLVPALPSPSNFSHHNGWKTILFLLWKNRCTALLPAAYRFLPKSVFPSLWSAPHITHAVPHPDFPFLLPWQKSDGSVYWLLSVFHSQTISDRYQIPGERSCCC